MASKRKRSTRASVAPVSDPAANSPAGTPKRTRLPKESGSSTRGKRSAVTSKTRKQSKTSILSPPEPDPETQSPEPCRLLDLPPELRNLVYSKVLEDFPAILHPRNHGNLICASRLLGTNHQVRSELLSELYLTAPIYAQVFDWNFSHIITFLNKLSNSEFKTLPHKIYGRNPHEPNKIVGREMGLEIVLSTLSRDEQALLRSPAMDRAPKLEKWVRRMNQKDKRRLTADVRYKVTCTNPDRFRNLVTLRCWECYLGNLRSNSYEGASRARQELTAIRVAVLEENKAILELILDGLQNGG